MAAADPAEARRLAQATAELYRRAEAELQAIVRRRLERGITSPGWAGAKLLEVQKLRAEAEAVLARLSQQTAPLIANAIEQAADRVRVAGSLGPRTNQRAVQVLTEDAMFRLSSTHTQILRSVEDSYRQTAARMSSQSVVGVESTQSAARKMVRDLTAQGITSFVDKAGKRWKMSTYAEMAMRTATARAMVESRLQEYADAGRHLVIVSDSPDECERCAPWEGQILSIDGVELTKEDRELAVASVRDATDKGLFHPNCTHDLRPYIHGLTRV